MTLTFTAVISVVFGNQSIAVDVGNNSEAVSMAAAQLETKRAQAAEDFALVNPSAATVMSGPLSYTKKVEVSQPDFFTKLVTSRVSWQDAGRTLSVLFTTLITNPDALHGGDTCSSVLEGDWTNPDMRSYEFGADVLNDTSSGFPITSIQTFNHKLYATVDNENGNNDETFFILDISDPSTKPSVLGK
jgi:hypothetical protein